MRRWLLLSVVLILALSVVAVSCGGSSTTTTTAGGASSSTTASTTGSSSSSTTASTSGGATTTTAAAGGGAQVTIKGFAFDPVSVTIKVGQTVTWTNQDSTNHTVTADKGEFSSDPLATGSTFTSTFNTAGTYKYHCSIHPTMTGTVVVQ